MTLEDLSRLEAMHADVHPAALAEIYQWFPEMAKTLREALIRAQTWEDEAQKVVALFDPLNPSVSPGVLSAVAQGVKTANQSLRADRAELRAEVDKLKTENANLLRQIEWHWARP